MTFSQQMEFTNRENRFMNHCGIRITKLEPECCEAQLSVADLFRHADAQLSVADYCKNTGETIHGGLLYTMADCVVSAFARALGDRPVTLSGDFHYLSNVTEGTLTALATPIHSGRTIKTFQVTISAGEKLLATGTFSCFDRGPEQK